MASVRAAETAGVKREAEIGAAQRELREATDSQAKAESAWRDWRESWAELLDRLHRPISESPEALSAVLGGMVTLDQHHRDATSLERRITAMQANLDRFATDVAKLAENLDEQAAATPADMAGALISRAAAAANAESAWRQAQLGLEQAQKAAAEGEAGLADRPSRCAKRHGDPRQTGAVGERLAKIV